MLVCTISHELVGNFQPDLHRNQLFADTAKFIVNFDTLCLEDKFLLLLGSQQLDVNLLVLNYVNKCFETQAMHQE